MITAPKAIPRIALYESEGAHPLTNESRVAITRTLLEKGYAVSSVRAEVVPTATMRPFRWRTCVSRSTVASGNSHHSECMR